MPILDNKKALKSLTSAPILRKTEKEMQIKPEVSIREETIKIKQKLMKQKTEEQQKKQENQTKTLFFENINKN